MRFLSLASFLLALIGFPAAALASRPVAAAVSIDAADPSGGFTAVSQDFVAPHVVHTNGINLPENVVLGQIPSADRSVVLEMRVDKTGGPENIHLVSSGAPFLNLPVLHAATQFRFSPARVHDQPVPFDVRVSVHVLDSSSDQ